MIDDRSLENHLNCVKEGKEPVIQKNPNEYTWTPSPKIQEEISLSKKVFIDVYNSLTKTLGILLASILYGFGIDALAGQDWNFLQISGVGLLFNHTLTTFPTIIKKLFTNQ